MPIHLPGEEVIFNTILLKNNGKLAFKENPLTRENFCDRLEGIKIVIELALFATIPPVYEGDNYFDRQKLFESYNWRPPY